jgi:hypothetical protein
LIVFLIFAVIGQTGGERFWRWYRFLNPWLRPAYCRLSGLGIAHHSWSLHVFTCLTNYIKRSISSHPIGPGSHSPLPSSSSLRDRWWRLASRLGRRRRMPSSFILCASIFLPLFLYSSRSVQAPDPTNHPFFVLVAFPITGFLAHAHLLPLPLLGCT